MAGAVDARQMAFADAQLAANAILGIHRQRPRRHDARALPLFLVNQLRFVVAVGIDHVVRRRDKLLLHHFSRSVQKDRRGIALGKFRPSVPDLVQIGQLFGFHLARQLLAVLIQQIVGGQHPPAINHTGQQQKQNRPHRDAEGAGPSAGSHLGRRSGRGAGGRPAVLRVASSVRRRPARCAASRRRPHRRGRRNVRRVASGSSLIAATGAPARNASRSARELPRPTDSAAPGSGAIALIRMRRSGSGHGLRRRAAAECASGSCAPAAPCSSA